MSKSSDSSNCFYDCVQFENFIAFGSGHQSGYVGNQKWRQNIIDVRQKKKKRPKVPLKIGVQMLIMKIRSLFQEKQIDSLECLEI